MLRSVYAGLFLATLAYTAQVLIPLALIQGIACYACGGFCPGMRVDVAAADWSGWAPC